MAVRGAPPSARVGAVASSAGRPIVPGVAPFLRRLSPRAGLADLWASVEAFGVQRNNSALSARSQKRYNAFLAQARQYYSVVQMIDPVAKPLPGYYFVLNLTKAFLTAYDPGLTEPRSLEHGASSRPITSTRYRFTQETITIKHDGVFRVLAECTGDGYCYANGKTLRIADLVPYLVEAYDLLAVVLAAAPSLVPILETRVLFGPDAGKTTGWLRVELDKNELISRKLSGRSLLEQAAIFAKYFELVQDSGYPDTFSYQTKASIGYGKKRSETFQPLAEGFDSALIGTYRSLTNAPRFLVLSERTELLSHEAVTFLVMLHLSNMVRYHPYTVENLRGGKYFWLFASWVDRACENFLLNIASRITGEEHCFV